jgi:hypothetical protein
MSKHKESENEYLFKVNLKGRRSIWRTVLLRGDQTLDDLHDSDQVKLVERTRE